MVLDTKAEFQNPVVISFIPGRSAAVCGRIAVGDRLIAVGAQSTRGCDLLEVRGMIVGPTGSTVLLRFEGPNGAYECNLVRGGGGSVDAGGLVSTWIAPDFFIVKKSVSLLAPFSHPIAFVQSCPIFRL